MHTQLCLERTVLKREQWLKLNENVKWIGEIKFHLFAFCLKTKIIRKKGKVFLYYMYWVFTYVGIWKNVQVFYIWFIILEKVFLFSKCLSVGSFHNLQTIIIYACICMTMYTTPCNAKNFFFHFSIFFDPEKPDGLWPLFDANINYFSWSMYELCSLYLKKRCSYS